MVYSYISLGVYSALWFFSLVHYLKKTKYLGAGVTILALYFVISICSFFAYSALYTDLELSLFPFIYLFGCILIASQPVLHYNEGSVKEIDHPRAIFVDLFVILYIFCALTQIPGVISRLSEGITQIITDSAAGEELYKDAKFEYQGVKGGASNLLMAFFNHFADVSFIVFFYYWIRFPKRIFVLLIFGGLIVFQVLNAISNGLRSGTVLKIMTLFIAFVTMRRFMSRNQKRIVYIIGGVFAFFVVGVVLIVTYSRFVEVYNQEMGSSLVDYIGQCNINFNEYVLDNKVIRNGDRTANLFKRMIGFDIPSDYLTLRSKYKQMKIGDESFTTFVGDIVLDYGPILTILLIVIFSLYFCSITKLKNNRLSMHQLIALYFAMCVLVQGSFYLFAYSFQDNYKILSFILMYFYFYIEKYSRKGKRIAI